MEMQQRNKQERKMVNKKERNVMASENRTFDWLMRRKDYGTL